MSSAVILQAINGISLAALLFLLSSGFTLTFGLMRVVNMAYGAYYLLGGYVGYSVVRATGNFELAIVCGGLAIVVLGYFVDRFLIRPIGSNHLAQVLLTVGVAFVIGEVCLAVWGGDNLRVQTPSYLGGSIALPGDIYYPRYRFALILFGVFTSVTLWFLYKKTQIGAVVRAGVDDREMVNATGINVDRLFALVSALASLNPGAEWDILVLALVVVIIGGLGSLEGAILGSIIVGLLDAYGRWLFPELSYFILFGPMAILLLFRATGIFGKEH
jgi:branched-chain amino acid transport system permease protein